MGGGKSELRQLVDGRKPRVFHQFISLSNFVSLICAKRSALTNDLDCHRREYFGEAFDTHSNDQLIFCFDIIDFLHSFLLSVDHCTKSFEFSLKYKPDFAIVIDL